MESCWIRMLIKRDNMDTKPHEEISSNMQQFRNECANSSINMILCSHVVNSHSFKLMFFSYKPKDHLVSFIFKFYGTVTIILSFLKFILIFILWSFLLAGLIINPSRLLVAYPPSNTSWQGYPLEFTLCTTETK